MRDNLTLKQMDKIDITANAIRSILKSKTVSKNSKPVFLKINMAQGGFRSIEEYTQETVNTINL